MHGNVFLQAQTVTILLRGARAGSAGEMFPLAVVHGRKNLLKNPYANQD